MITADWVRLMARHTAWQNGWMGEAIVGLPIEEAQANRGLFFGSILGTANHILWGDRAWLARLDAGDPPDVAPADHTRLTPTPTAWAVARQRTDAAIQEWADGLTGPLDGHVLWTSALTGAENRTPRAVAVTHLFLHGVHHRGQIHAALTQMGVKTADTDLPYLPEAQW
ncbi:diguanylate cyclase [Jannaschia pagri]|uniref:Diguanylate cyclase n=1 Tax=Jannaschia pagri TaxID=2829797 RepID=A0ABQ4NMV9_9RHOB|nr:MULTISPECIES: DinB family protein [unclassified Jannaschia]GIT91906.1 diguanylate cyclase [Jannaschia sp. AI_61]GIT95740.1 diguanylate cyclase [Jannaschia sp. AI_62]